MAVQVRRGPYSDFNANKLVPGEWAAVTSGDPNASDGCATYMCFAPGNVKRMATYEDMAENINAATSEIQGNFSAEMNAAMGAANAAAASAQSAAAEAETAKESANTAAANANTAAEAANAAANGDVSGKTVTFQEATERANVQSGDSLEVAFGKLAKFCADLKDYAFEDTVKNLTTGEQGKALDATMGKALDEKIGNLNDLTTTSKDSVVDAVDELNMNMKMLYMHNGRLVNTGDASLAALISRLVRLGYYNGVVSTINFPEFSTQSWTYIVRWSYSFDNYTLVETFMCINGERKWNWLNLSNGTWQSSTWFTS